MKNKIIKILFFSIIFIFIMFMKNKVDATSISFSPQNPKVGDTVTVTVSVANINTVDLTANISGSANGTIRLVNGDLSGGLNTFSQSGQFKCEKEGTLVANIANSSTAVSNGNYVDVGASASVKVSNKTDTSSSNNSGTSTSTANSNTNTTSKSNVATLANLGIKPNDFSGFKSNTTSYSTEVPNDVETIEIYASKGQSGQTITGTGKKNLKEGSNTFEINVTAEDGKTKKTYTLNITRKTNDEDKDKKDETETEIEENEEEPIDIFGLSELKIKNLKLNPQFQTDIYEYKIDLTEDIDKLDISTVATDVNSNIEITGNEQLEEGENIITILVTGEDGEKSAAYQIIVNKKIATIGDTENKEQYDMKKIIIIAGSAVLVLIVAIIIIVKVIKNKKDNQYYDDDYEEDDDYEDENDYNNIEEIDENNYEDVTSDFVNEEPSEDYYKEEKVKKKKRSKGKRFK